HSDSLEPALSESLSHQPYRAGLNAWFQRAKRVRRLTAEGPLVSRVAQGSRRRESLSWDQRQFLCVHGLPPSVPVSKHICEQGPANFAVCISRNHNTVYDRGASKDTDLQVFKVFGFS